ncbi:PREDICTED: short coiled-coil protein isoform X2 [Ceratotherium simum simum]|uniref:Short coiled-coil protein isoform X2 n=1 Tax=Ceratotherium simum simum TaxID=73337 RepID=A0ABM1CKB2_CERSS|nr:PREDICTED: short coiled-coil protein isoform X2 [Ceratotherium simum simum]
MRRRALLSGDWRATGRDGAGLPSRRRLCGRRGRSCRCQLVQVSRPEAFCRSLPLPAPRTADHSSRIFYPRPKSLLPKMMNADMDAVDAENQVELEEKTRLINQVLELQHTLEGPFLSLIEATLKPTENKTALGMLHPDYHCRAGSLSLA